MTRSELIKKLREVGYPFIADCVVHSKAPGQTIATLIDIREYAEKQECGAAVDYINMFLEDTEGLHAETAERNRRALLEQDSPCGEEQPIVDSREERDWTP